MKMGHSLKKTDFLQMCVANDFEYHWPELAYISVDANGNVTSITPPGRPAHNFTFDPRDLETYYNPPDIGIGTVNTQYAYNLDKQLTLITRPDGQTISFNYDNGGRLSTITVPTGNITYTYNSTTGNTGTITSPDETLSFSYDGSLLTGTSWSGSVTGSVGFAYNNDFRVTSESVNGANSVSYSYDNDGLLTGAGSLSINHNSQNGLITGSTLGSVSDSFTYSSFGEPSSYTASINGSSAYSVSYSRDNLGRITSKTETVSGTTSTYAYTYDQAGRLTDVSKNGTNTVHHDYDTNGNREGWAVPTGSGTATYDNQDRLVSYGSTTYSYPANGELQTKTVVPSQSIQFNYDVLGNLVSATLADGTQIQYVVDGQNRRIGKKVNGVLVQGFLYENQLRPVAELDGAGNVVSRFVYGTKPNIPEYMVKGGITYRIITDHLGSPRLVVNSSTGAIAQQMDYDEFGNVTNDTNPGFMPFGFAGGLYDRDTKLTRFGARDYDAVAGRWLSKDPIRFKGGTTNLYQYVNNPINEIDPLGLWYVDFNVTIGQGLGVTFGVMVNDTGIYPYTGGGLTTSSGGSITWSPYDPTTGWNTGIQYNSPYIVGGQYGYGGGETFWEVGIGSPGVSWMGYYVFGPFWEPNNLFPPNSARCQ